ncbi:MAG: hypothetical protein HQK94_19480, partial [Nitrospirae bacterium]|nr:hypothetical protein [Nitrospirota bacterium]
MPRLGSEDRIACYEGLIQMIFDRSEGEDMEIARNIKYYVDDFVKGTKYLKREDALLYLTTRSMDTKLFWANIIINNICYVLNFYHRRRFLSSWTSGGIFEKSIELLTALGEPRIAECIGNN